MRTIIFAITVAILSSIASVVQSELQKEDILEVDYIRDGTRGYVLKLKITQDSIIYENFGPAFHNPIAGKIENDQKTWNSLVMSIDLKVFDEIKSAPGRGYIDGGDEHLDIKTSLHTHALLLDLNNRKPIEKTLDQINCVLAKIKGIR
jgi:hypothetical protein